MTTPPSNLDRLLETFDELWSDFVDPADALYDADAVRWRNVGQISNPSRAPFDGPDSLAEIRDQCRSLAVENEFAINGHENPVR